MLACPFLILAIALAAFLGPSLGNAMIAIGISATPIFIRLTRGQVMSVKVEDYVEAARAIGNPRWRIALRHILPNIMPALLVQATLSIAAAIIAEAALSFLGLGQQPPAPSWGSMLNAAQRFLDQRAVDGDLAGAGDLPGGAVVQSGRRRPARRARSAGRVEPSSAQSPVYSRIIFRGGNPSRIRDRPPAAGQNARSGRNAPRRGGRVRPTSNGMEIVHGVGLRRRWCPSSRSRTRRCGFPSRRR